MSPEMLRRSLDNLNRALDRLEEGLAAPESSTLAVDGTIQRFELCWKTLKRLLSLEGMETTTPHAALQAAYGAGWLKDETPWLQMLRDRNSTSHLYDEAKARMIYERIRQYHPALRAAASVVAERQQALTRSEPPPGAPE